MSDLKKIAKNREIILSLHTLIRIIKGIINAKLFKRSTLRTIELYPTFSCQLECDICSMNKYNMVLNKATLNITQYSNLAREAAKLGATTLIILGGEPTLYPYICELIRAFNKEHYFIHMVSNGLALTEKYMSKLKSSGLNCLFLSLDSMSPETNDKIRCIGHFHKTMENINVCRKINLEVGLAPVFYSGHINQALEVIKYCNKQKIRASGGQIAPTGKAMNIKCLSQKEIQQVKCAMKKYSNFVFDWSFSYFNKPCCPAGKEKVGITMYGDVIPCSYNPIGFGNVFNEPLKDIIKRMGKFSQFKKDFSGCLCSEDESYIINYLYPAAASVRYPMDYNLHPKITPKTEPDMFK